MTFKVTLALGFSLALAASSAHAQTNQEYAKFDPATRTWELNFQQQNVEDDSDADWRTFRYEIANAIKPTVRSTVRSRGDAFVYQYRVSNHRSAPQVIDYLYAWTPITPLPPEKPDPTGAELNASPELMRAWNLQLDARLDEQKAMRDAALSQPTGWRRAMSFDKQEIGFGWFPTIEPYGPGIAPGRSVGGFEIRRPELPGATYAKMQGRVDEPGLPTSYKPGGPVEQAIKEIIATDQVYVPILVPAITLPTPYSRAEHARRLKAHAQTWLGDETHSPMVSSDVLDRLNRQFDVLIPALDGNNKAAARAAVIEMFKESFGHHQGLNHHKLSEDDEDQDAEALPHKVKARAGAQQELPKKPLTIHRVPARALAFNLLYLLTRMEIGR